jgi:hypothetical protein
MGGPNVRGWLGLALAGAALAAFGCDETTSNQASQASAPGNSTPTTETSTSEGSGGKEGPGSLSHAEDAQFCETHHCIANFDNGHGEVVECSDGEWSHSGGISGACSDHGGVASGSSQGGGSGGSSQGGGSGESHSESTPKEESGSAGEKEGPGSTSHAEDAQFCSTHTCIANFPNGNGAVVECNDGEWSHSGGLSGACSDHGGENASSASAGKSGESGTPGNESASGEALDTLNKYWSDIRDHGFAEAYGYLGPGAAGKSESQFISSEEQAGVKNAQFHGTVTNETGSTATVNVDSLTTEDSEFGCRRWNGTYTLSREDGSWRIQKAALTPHSC